MEAACEQDENEDRDTYGGSKNEAWLCYHYFECILQASFYTFDFHPLYIFFHNFQVLLIGEIY